MGVYCITVFPIMVNSRFEETGVLRAALEQLRRTLPPAWSVLAERPRRRSSSPDVVLRFVGPGGAIVRVAAAVKVWPTAPSSAVRGVLEPLARQSPLPVILVTDFVNRPLRAVCDDLGVGYVDTTGWVSLSLAEPLVALRSTGADRRPGPVRQGNVQRLSGSASGRIIMELLERGEEIGVRELASAAGVSPGAVSKVLPALADAGALDRTANGGVTAVNRRALLERWSRDYTFASTTRSEMHVLFPRGVPQLLDALKGAESVLLTGAAAAPAYLPPGIVPVAPTTKVSAYARSASVVAEELRALPVDATASNLVLLEPKDLSTLEPAARTPQGLPTVGLGRVLIDLITATGRESLIADQLMDSLEWA